MSGPELLLQKSTGFL